MKQLIKYHKWLSIIFSVFIVIYSISGIILNHRDWLSEVDIPRNFLPDNYAYRNWNNASAKGSITIDTNRVLFYGNMGVWLTDSNFSNFEDFNKGFPSGIDNRKVSVIYQCKNTELLAGTLMGLYRFDKKENIWQQLTFDTHDQRITDIIEVGNEIWIQTRSYIYKTKDLKTFDRFVLPKPDNYHGKIGLFKTLWVIHSGEIYGIVGKILVDLVGIIFVFLTITGLIVFYNKLKLKHKSLPAEKASKLKRRNKWNLKWHNKLGWTTVFFLVLTTLTGMFLRPPLLIPIANVLVPKIPYSELDSPNPWLDQLRGIRYDSNQNIFIVVTNEGVFYSDDFFKSELKKFQVQPPISVMGITVFEPFDANRYLIGSFEGLFLWDIQTQQISDVIKNQPYKPVVKRGSPIGAHLVSGAAWLNRDLVYFDYNSGAHFLNSDAKFSPMPSKISESQFSIWSLALELHTGRFFEFAIGSSYILIVPLVGLVLLFILLSGFWIWYKRGEK